MKDFWRIPNTSGTDIREITYIGPPGLAEKLKEKHGLVLSTWDETSLNGHVEAFGLVTGVDVRTGTATVEWREADVTLRPKPSGRQFWRNKPFFRFADAVAARYMLDDLFAEHFPELDDLSSTNTQPRQSRLVTPGHQIVQGFVYLIKSPYGYKIGKTVNIKHRYRLFGVKLPFPIELINYAHFDDYTGAEKMLHDKFKDKRLEGEWFDLNDQDIERIKSFGKQMSLDGLV